MDPPDPCEGFVPSLLLHSLIAASLVLQTIHASYFAGSLQYPPAPLPLGTRSSPEAAPLPPRLPTGQSDQVVDAALYAFVKGLL